MAYTVMKLHKRYLMPMESLDEFCNYLQIKLEKDFCFDDDAVISTMERSMEELKRAKLDYPGLPLPQELPRYPFGTFKEPSFTNKVLSECFCLAFSKSHLLGAKYQRYILQYTWWIWAIYEMQTQVQSGLKNFLESTTEILEIYDLYADI